MISRNIFNIAQSVRKVVYFSKCFISPNSFFSTETVNLSFSKFQPVELVDKTPVVILHGFLGSKQNWRSLARAVAERSGRQVYALDARNHGDSPHSDSFSYSLMAEDVRHFMEAEAIASAVLVGHSMGGRTVMKLALTEEQLVDKLVVIDVSPIRMPESSAVLIPSYLSAMKAAIASVQNLGIVQARKLMDEHLAQSIPEAGIRQFLLTNLTQVGDGLQWKANVDILQQTFDSEIYSFSQFSGRYTRDTLFICGGESPYVKEEDRPLIQKLFPRAKFIVVAEAGHWVHSEKPAEFLEALCRFL